MLNKNHVIAGGIVAILVIGGAIFAFTKSDSAKKDGEQNDTAIDTAIPTAPSELTLQNARTTSITLSWKESTDNVGVVGYDVFVDNIPKVVNLSALQFTIPGLSKNTSYTINVKGRDAAGNLSLPSMALVVKTSNITSDETDQNRDTTAPLISNVSAVSTTTGILVSWTTDEQSDSQIEYGKSISLGTMPPADGLRSARHQILLTGLSYDTRYYFQVKSRDAAGNLALSLTNTFVTPQAPDTTAPALLDIKSENITSNSASIVWTTSEAADGQVEYGKTSLYASSTDTATVKTLGHSFSLSGLEASEIYHYRVKSKDIAGNATTSADRTFVTLAGADTGAPVVGALSVTGITSTEATVSWTTSEMADSQVEYG